jgi:hypothetical protein
LKLCRAATSGFVGGLTCIYCPAHYVHGFFLVVNYIMFEFVVLQESEAFGMFFGN